MLDIDGTLAPIAPRPEDARIPEVTRATLRRLVDLPGTHVALVTGRSAEDARRMALPGVWIVGNHGLELQTPDGDTIADPDAVPYESAITRAANALAPLQQELRGVLLENKHWGLGIHFRLADPEALERIRRAVNDVAADTGLRVTEGRKIFELRPPLRVDKGTATIAFLERIDALSAESSAIFVGDDRTDEDAFRALRQLAPHAVTVRVLAGDDAPHATDAELLLSSPEEVRELLDWLVKRRAARTA
jgi:trehalose-phosphatase